MAARNARGRSESEGEAAVATNSAVRLFPPPRLAMADDTAAIVVFAVVGNVSHYGDVSARGLARDVLPLLGGWLGAGALFGLYRRPTLGRLAATWLVGVTAGVVVRAAVLAPHERREGSSVPRRRARVHAPVRARGASAYRLGAAARSASGASACFAVKFSTNICASSRAFSS